MTLGFLRPQAPAPYALGQPPMLVNPADPLEFQP
jgi:hypothetical protein